MSKKRFDDEELMEAGDLPTQEDEFDNAPEPPAARSRTSIKDWFKRISLVLRIGMFLLTAAAVLFVIAVQVIAIIYASPLQNDTIPSRIGLYGICGSQILIGIVVVFLEMDIGLVRTFFKFASFYVGKSILQIFLGLLCFSQAVKYDVLQGAPEQLAQFMPLVKEIAGYIMFSVGALHFILGILCLDIVLIRTRAWY